MMLFMKVEAWWPFVFVLQLPCQHLFCCQALLACHILAFKLLLVGLAEAQTSDMSQLTCEGAVNDDGKINAQTGLCVCTNKV